MKLFDFRSQSDDPAAVFLSSGDQVPSDFHSAVRMTSQIFPPDRYPMLGQAPDPDAHRGERFPGRLVGLLGLAGGQAPDHRAQGSRGRRGHGRAVPPAAAGPSLQLLRERRGLALERHQRRRQDLRHANG